RDERACRFFFQAEDGIRDFHVTGVQTCALPIWNRWMDKEAGFRRDVEVVRAIRKRVGRDVKLMVDANNGFDLETTLRWLDELGRSEERRVGKEGRSRWAPAHETREE